jgi:RNA polymerase sigma-70 factor (ECF subfamily)
MTSLGSANPLSHDEFQRAFSDWYVPVRNFIYFRCGDIDLAEDLAQDAFIKLWESRERVERSTLKAYLYKIAQNQTINYQKRQQLFFRFQKQGSNDRDFDTPEKMMEMEEYENRLQEVIAALPDGGREVFLMNRLEDLTYQEIADRLGLSVKAIEKRMSKVLQIFRDQLGTEL